MKNTRILISGASIGGPALAYWLGRYGFDVTVVERSPGLRPGGQAIDVRGPALGVAEKMGILDDIRALRTGVRGMSLVDEAGKELYRSEDRTLTDLDFAGADVEIMRDDLSRLIVDAAGGTDGPEYLFGDSIASLEQTENEVAVTFENSAPRTFDLVVGADGLHSNVRRLVFGPEERFIRHLGTYLAVFTAPNFLGLDHWQTMCVRADGSWGGAMSVRDNTEARVYLGFEPEEPLAYDYRDTDSHKKLLADRLADGGWEFPNALTHMWNAPDFHFDSMSQIHMDSWSHGRVVLLGDSGYCGSPMSGQGTSMAMVGAYVLAGELRAADGDHRTAFAAYESELREYVSLNQQLALANKARWESEVAALNGESVSGDAEKDLMDFATVVNSFSPKDYQ
ncbi:MULTISPECIES: FAD-dependent monooxygenase [Streptomyces]|uniref:FAD-binding protein n=1 Tax=Streptomyces luteosporeus TaxID=173856 RepID=A0ABP6G0V7_9ACTN